MAVNLAELKRYKRTFDLRVAGRTYQQIAETLHISRATAYRRVQLALDMLEAMR